MTMSKSKFNLKDPKYRIPLVLVLITILGIYYWYSETYTPIKVERTSLQAKLKAKKDTLRVIQALKPQLAMLKKELHNANEKLDSLKSIFPDQKEIPKLIKEITAVAKASGIHTTKFNPMPDLEREYFIENRYSISVEGGYHSLADFYAFLANFPLIINLSHMNIIANPEYKSKMLENENDVFTPTSIAMFEMTTFSSKQ